jgi:excisionase family DNA binding protein
MVYQSPQRPFLTIQQVAELLDLDYKTVYRMVVAGQLPAAKLGGSYRIRRADLDTFFEQQKVVGHAPRASIPAVEPASCARCGRALRVPSLVGGKCRAEGCDLALCTKCWAERDKRLCREHGPEES